MFSVFLGDADADAMFLQPWLDYHQHIFDLAGLRRFPVGSDLSDAARRRITGETDNSLIFASCRDFLALHGTTGLVCEPAAIRAELSAWSQTQRSARPESSLWAVAGTVDLFRYRQIGRLWLDRTQVVPVVPTRLTILTFAEDHDVAGDAETPLIRFSGLRDVVGAAVQPISPSQIGRRLVLDLDHVDFQPEAYLSANPGLQASDPFDHFVRFGFAEGRPVNSSVKGTEEVADRLAMIRTTIGDGVAGFVNMAWAMTRAGRYDEAEAMIADAIASTGETMTLMREHALLATYGQQGELSAARWETFRSRYPDSPDGYLHGSVACRGVGRLAEAEAIAAAGQARFPEHQGLAFEVAEIAGQAGQWKRAQQLWRILLVRNPGDGYVQQKIGEANYHLDLTTLDGSRLERNDAAHTAKAETGSAAASERHGIDGVEPSTDLFNRFESLGNSCEFGLVQRHFGAEPLGLLRWVVIDFENLVAALTARLEGFENPDNLDIVREAHEFVLRDRLYGTNMHTFINDSKETSESLRPKLSKRMSFLRRKMLSDFEDAEKVFVRLELEACSYENIMRLDRAFRVNSDAATLLHVQRAPSPNLIGSVVPLTDTLLVGYLGHLGRDETGAWDIDFDNWRSICQAALAHQQLVRRNCTTALEIPA